MTTTTIKNVTTHDGRLPATFPVRLTQRLEQASALDRLQRAPQALADGLLSPSWLRDALHGRWLGHALHPLLTDLPLGAWTSATILDLAGGRGTRKAAERLVAFGLVTAVPTAVTGLAEWGSLTGEQRRVGLVHATANTVALTLYTASFMARRQRRQGAGVMLALAGGAVATIGGYLGGHMTIARKIGSRHPVFGPPVTG